MPTNALPVDPSLDHVRGQAKSLHRAVRAGDADAVARAKQFFPGELTDFALSKAQLVIAREYGFSSWPRLKQYIDDLSEFRWDVTDSEPDDTTDRFCDLACLTYSGADGPARWARARELLAAHPDLVRDHIWAAATAGDAEEVRRLLAADRGLARRRGGPRQWAPLFYLAYSRLDLDVPAEPVLTIARLLLEAGADPNEGYFWDGHYGFTLLTGVFGEGEQGPERQPRHPHEHELARLLLDAGANPNDAQTLYDRMFRPGNEHLELLLSRGLGAGDPGRWAAGWLFGDGRLESPADLLRAQLWFAIGHDFLDRVRLLVEHGVDVHAPFDGVTPIELAAREGNPAIVELLTEAGAVLPSLDPVDALTAAVLGGDRPAVERLRAAHPEAVTQLRPGLIVWATAKGRHESVRLLLELAVDVNSRGRHDAPIEGGSTTALHIAAADGDVELVQLLLSHGADTSLRDADHDATPLDWARYTGQDAVVSLLESSAV